MNSHYLPRRNNFPLIILLIFFVFSSSISIACDCAAFPPLTKELFNSSNPRQVVFKGKVLKVGECKDLGSLVFEVQELYFGKSTKHLDAVYDCSSSCMMNFEVGEDWIIYGEYLQLEKIKVEFCSRSRKIMSADYAEVDQIAYGITAKDEISWLQKNIGVKDLKPVDENRLLAHKNEKPNPITKIILIAVSILVMVIFLVLIKRFLK